MKTQVSQTSLLAYRDITQKRLGQKQAIVLSVLNRIQPATNKMIAAELNWPINTITPRVKELREMKRVVEGFKAHDDSGRLASFWTLESYGV